MPTRHPATHILTGLLCLLLLGNAVSALRAQTVNATSLSPTDGGTFGTALASSGSALFLGDSYGTNGIGTVSVCALVSGTLTRQLKLSAPDTQPYDLFGTALSASGNLVAIGAPFHNDTGAVYLYKQTGATWSLAQEILPVDGVGGDFFGCAVSLTSTTLAIGAYCKNGFGGVVYLYTLKGGKWVLQSELTTPNSTSASPGYFGYSVSLSGSTLLVGAPEQNSGLGAAYIYTSSTSGTWTQQTQLNPVVASQPALFGTAVALNGTQAAVGAPGMSMVCVYQVGSSPANWSLQTTLTPFEGDGIDNFGTMLALSANTLVVSAVNTDDNEAYVYTLQKNVWTPYAELSPFDVSANGGYGTGIALYGAGVAISRPYLLTGSSGSQGTVYAFHFTDEAHPPQGRNNDNYGTAVAINALNVFSGTPGRNNDTGAVYLYTPSTVGLGTPIVMTAPSGQSGDQYGAALACNSTTLAVGAPGAKNGQGAVYLYTYQSGAWKLTTTLTAKDGAAGDAFGASLALSANTLLIGAPGRNDTTGAAYVYTLSAKSWTQQAELSASDGQGGDQFGLAVSLDGNNILIGAPYADTPADYSTGAAYTFAFTNGKWTSVTKLFSLASLYGDAFGTSVAISGNQAAVGAPGSDSGNGAIYPFVLAASGWTPQQPLPLIGADSQFGGNLLMSGSTLLVQVFDSAFARNGIRTYTLTSNTWLPTGYSYGVTSQPNDAFGAAIGLYGNVAVVGAPNAYDGIGKLYIVK